MSQKSFTKLRFKKQQPSAEGLFRICLDTETNSFHKTNSSLGETPISSGDLDSGAEAKAKVDFV